MANTKMMRILVNPSLAEALDDAAERDGTTISYIAREALQLYLAKRGFAAISDEDLHPQRGGYQPAVRVNEEREYA